MAGYDGPVVDAFLHTPWLGGDDRADPRGDDVDWHGDPRSARVMHRKKHGLIARPAQRTRRSREQLPTSRDRAHRRRFLMYLARQRTQAERP
jgi:hypothetical protein